MFRQSLRLARKKNFGARQLSVPPTPITLLRPYSNNQTTQDNSSPNDPAQTLTQVDSISSVIKQDHRQIEKYHHKILNSKDHDTQRRYQNAFVWELTRHAIAEELVVYPSMETGLNNGKEIADKDREEHQIAKEQLYKFQNMTPDDSDFIPTLESLMTDLKIHIQQEEEHDLVKLEEALRPTRSRDLAQQFEMTKVFTPTRSHPSAPNKPPYETAAGLMTAPLDKLGDMFRAWPDEPGPKPASGGAGR
ncbi:hypothetical protein GL218_02380 [Daldinia childiae]|uniref:uncharacterized protein n=1 Tax=Daldinia childiae TaxID=326645 RepID=UPI001444D436|nr:uncharacterized protein GL218_02380 [Daldinia childiae]KAF3064199.1 hypothetical protein GL218_02380 [Daldinia childiae]